MRAWMSWSSGKDSAHALAAVRADVVGLVTTVSAAYDRVAMHAVRRALLERQAAALRLPLTVVELPTPCTNDEYEARFGAALVRAREEGVTHIVFGDLFLADVRAYRERQLAAVGLTPVFPLWQRDTRELAHEMIASGLRARLTCVDPRVLERTFAGREFDESLLADLPASVDPCGERGEFHTFVTHSPLFSTPIAVTLGEVVERDGFVFADCLDAAL
ncbi:MAG TPA: hypothetical protein VMZ53_27000 [Kofleriaceae bacterium]|nr:hypothetical protein [Kofleriaceae bacterium]